MRRATMGWDSGLISEDQGLHIVGLKDDKGSKKTDMANTNRGELPRENSTENESKPDIESEDSKDTDN